MWLIVYPPLDAEEFKGWPLAEVLKEGDEPKPAQFVFVYDFACGALASLIARSKAVYEDPEAELPPAVACWALESKWIVDKFHFKTHVGMCLLYNTRPVHPHDHAETEPVVSCRRTVPLKLQPVQTRGCRWTYKRGAFHKLGSSRTILSEMESHERSDIPHVTWDICVYVFHGYILFDTQRDNVGQCRTM
jgi:hypothetical protein